MALAERSVAQTPQEDLANFGCKQEQGTLNQMSQASKYFARAADGSLQTVFPRKSAARVKRERSHKEEDSMGGVENQCGRRKTKQRALQSAKPYPTSRDRTRKEPTAYQQRVYDLVSTIPKGKVTTYGKLAEVLKSHPRAVGNALRNNPFAPVVPCHRVVASTRHLHGFAGQVGKQAPNLIKKKALLQAENVIFEFNSDRVAEESMYDFRGHRVD
eukprot:CAMPEP_0184553014 /NCGR_PEP_ID=MMETSP0199_2-20130426/30636_1 /TAXON_ID=1112570 /ORGANISM="Thraustochytrium sp., Strain LLF1b" /LENGTH=214 /DNA_ID=CAMNT_0026948655 /DNA_START=19 /DNA_END=663 /DNA_ORIENTATION=+